MDYNVIKVALLGPSAVGKSSLASGLAKRPFDPGYIATIGADLMHRYIENERLKITIWDLGGLDQFSSIIRPYISGSDLVILCYDSCCYISYRKLLEKYKKIKQQIGSKPICIVSTKNDKSNSNMDFDCGKDLAIRLDCSFFATSARDKKFQEVLDWMIQYSREKFENKLEEEEKSRKFCTIL